jgi:hypothetical protein
MAEKTLPGKRTLYSAQRGFKDAFNATLVPVTQRLGGILMGYADSTGKIPQRVTQQALVAVGDPVQRVFVGNDFRSPFGMDGYTPLADYPYLLNYWLAKVTYDAVKPHSDYMQANLPQDIQAWLRRRTTVSEFTSNPRAQYDAPHTWVGPNGYTLSGRIWQTSVNTRVKIDKLLADGIRTGRSARDMANDLEQFLQPNRAAFRTQRPYGQDASADAMRLARSEITRAHSSASLAASQANPFVVSQDWALSASHPKFDICDGLATIGMTGDRIKEPYPLTGYVPLPVIDSHPHCLCNSRPGPLADMDTVIADLRAMMGRGEPPPVTPIDPWWFVKFLLGSFLASLIANEVM